MIHLQNVTKVYPIKKGSSVSAVVDLSLEIKRGAFMVVVGRSGSGKTTLLNLAAGLTQPSSGSVRLDGVELWQLADRQRSLLRGQKIGFVFQFPSLLPALSVLDNVLLPVLFSRRMEPGAGHDRAIELLKSVGLESKLNVLPRQLSAGQQQRVVIARALMNRPEILLADEPTSNLDEQTELEIMELFRELHRSLQLTVVMVTHTRQLIGYGSQSIEMANGQIVKNGSQYLPEHTIGTEVSHVA